MTELKTLKDLQEKDYYMKSDGKNIFGVPYVLVPNIKQEAIKWVKTLYEIQKKAIENNEMYHVNWQQRFIDFFNITEEDLK
jgi:hypothetical protein